MDTAQFRGHEVSSLCSLGLTPHLMTGVLRHLVGAHFADRRNIETPELRDLLWRAADVGNILVESSTRWQPSTEEMRPAVVIRQEAWQAERLFPDDQSNTSPQGDAMFLNLMHGSHTLFCIGESGEQAQVLAAEVFAELIGFASLIRNFLGLARFAPTGLGAMFQLEEVRPHYVVPITVAYCHHMQWTIQQAAPRLRHIDVLRASELMP